MKLYWPLILVIIGIVLIAFGVSQPSLSFQKFRDTCTQTHGQVLDIIGHSFWMNNYEDPTVCKCMFEEETVTYKDVKNNPQWFGCHIGI